MPGLTLSDHEWQVFDMPAPGDHYWHWTTGYRVERTGEVDGELRLHLMRNPAWEEEMSQGLPDDHLVDGGRSADSGQWHFRVVGPRGTDHRLALRR